MSDFFEKVEVETGFAGDDEGVDALITGHRGEGSHLAAELFGVLGGLGGVSVVDTGAGVLTLENFARESGSVNVGDANPGEIKMCGHAGQFTVSATSFELIAARIVAQKSTFLQYLAVLRFAHFIQSLQAEI